MKVLFLSVHLKSILLSPAHLQSFLRYEMSSTPTQERKKVCLGDVQKAMDENAVCDVGPILVHVVSYEATNAYPKKFYYTGCIQPTDKGRLCRRSVEKAKCMHDRTGEAVDDMYHFDIFLTDSSVSLGGRPVKATLFSPAADTLLQIGVGDLKRLDEQEQIQSVDWVIRTWPHCRVVLRISNGGAIIQSLHRVTSPGTPASIGKLLNSRSTTTPSSSRRQVDVEGTEPAFRSLTLTEKCKILEAVDLIKFSSMGISGKGDED